MSLEATHLKPDAYRDREIAADTAVPCRWRVFWTDGAKPVDVSVVPSSGKSKIRANVYPISLREGEEMQFPLAGKEHFVIAAEGRIEVLEPNTDRRLVLEPRETFRASRKSAKEFLNLRAAGLTERSLCVWIVIHHD